MGGRVDAGPTPSVDPNSKNKKATAAAGKKVSQQLKASQGQIKQFGSNMKGLQSPLLQANNQNYTNLTGGFETQRTAIEAFKAPFEGGNTAKTEFKLDPSVQGFNLEEAQKVFSGSALAYTDVLNNSNLDEAGNVDTAKGLGDNTSDFLKKASNYADESGNKAISSLTKIATATGMIWTGGFTFGATTLAAIPIMLDGISDGTQAFSNYSQAQNQSNQADSTSDTAYTDYSNAGAKLADIGSNFEQLKSLKDTFGNSVLPTLADAAEKNQDLVTKASSLGANVQAPENQANLAGTELGNSIFTPPPPNVADASWATPATGAAPTTALGVSPAGVNTTQANGQPKDLTEKERRVVELYEQAPTWTNSANAQAQDALGSAPPDLDTAPIAQTAKVEDPTKNQGLTALYKSLKEKEQQAQAQNKGVNALGTNANPLAPQEPLVNPADPNAVAQAPQDPAQRSLIIPSFAPKAPALQPALV
ncbi:MAG: hypothetical protein ACK5T0_09465 [Vampirovibrionales bacterium]